MKLRCKRSQFVTPIILLTEAFIVVKEMITQTKFSFIHGFHNFEKFLRQQILIGCLHSKKRSFAHTSPLGSYFFNCLYAYFVQLPSKLKNFFVLPLSCRPERVVQNFTLFRFFTVCADTDPKITSSLLKDS